VDIHVLGINSEAPDRFAAGLEKAIHNAAYIPLTRMCGGKRGEHLEAVNVFIPGCLGLGNRLVAHELVINVQELSADSDAQLYREGWTRSAVARRIGEAVDEFFHRPSVSRLMEGLEVVEIIVNVDEIKTWEERDKGMSDHSVSLRPFLDMG